MYTAQGNLDRASLIERYSPLVRRVAAQLIARLPASVEMDDLVQAGMIGLIDAMSRYQSDYGAQFETFAMQRVKGAMLDELREIDWLPRSVRKNQRTIENAIASAERRLRRAPSEGEVAAEMGMPLGDYQHLLSDARGAQLIYIDELGDDGAEEQLIGQGWSQDDADHLPGMLKDEKFRQALVEAIEGLPEREKIVMSLYYEQDMNLKEIGAVLGVTESRVCQMHSQAVARLRAKLRLWR